MLRFCALALILLLCAAPARAHPGRTDSQGGHYDHSTGNHLTRILSAEDEARDLKKRIESLTLVNRTLIAKNAKLTRDMQDISDLMTTVSALEHDVDQLSVECRRLKNANESFSVAYTGMTRRIQCLQEAASAGSPRHIIGHTGPMEAMVFIFGDHPSMFHTHIHGDWRNWRLIPLADAINKGYMPCKHCAILYNNALPDQSQYRLPRNT